MSKVRVHNFTISLDGFGTGEGQYLDAPFGHGGHIMDWFKGTKTFKAMIGHPDDSIEGLLDIDDDFARAWGPGIGCEIMGRNKFTPERGEWLDENWKGWWGDEPPFHSPCIVLTHHKKEPLVMGETTFYFKDASPTDALGEAKKLAGDKDIRIGGGATSLRHFFDARLVDYAHIAVAPVLLGRGELLFENLEGLEKDYTIKTTSSPSGVTHLEFELK